MRNWDIFYELLGQYFKELGQFYEELGEFVRNWHSFLRNWVLFFFKLKLARGYNICYIGTCNFISELVKEAVCSLSSNIPKKDFIDLKEKLKLTTHKTG